ncbi:50S ribosomal protein L35ae [Candidatus Woesearchaeota archaeon]|nr:50S ribosomal protein L35ae [Candidatus Woesearchaeota archaeon]
MEAVIVNFRRGRKTQKTNQMILTIKGYDKEKAKSLIKKTVIYRPEGKNNKELKGIIKAVHGNKGNVRAYFETGMPGQSVGKKVEVI